MAESAMASGAVDARSVAEKFDPEARQREPAGRWGRVILLIALAFSCYQLYTGLFGVLPAQLQRSWHLMFALVLIYLLYPARRRRVSPAPTLSDVFLAGAGLAVGLYLVVNYEGLMERAGLYSPADKVAAVVGLLLVLEATRRAVGWPIVAVASLFLVYAYLGPWIPGFLGHRGYTVDRIVTHMLLTTEGVLGIPLGVSATFIFLFILFGAFLEKTGIGRFFIDVANAIAGHAAGGPAKVAVLTSALEGTVSGSSVANTVGSGSFTIPLMKSLGYRPEFAAAVEAAASTGGQIMPPIMGAAAFLMAEFLDMRYVEVAKAAAIPAILYFAGIWIMVHLEAERVGLRGLPRDQLPRLGRLLRQQGYLVLPLVAIIYFLLEGYTPIRAALAGLGVTVITGLLNPSRRLTPRGILEALVQGARSALGVAAACATAGIIVGVVTLTGLGLKMADALLMLAQGNLVLTLFFVMLTSLILGMGVPTTANYVITSTIAAPAIVKLGVPMLAAHMFAFYFGVVADITPPVALAAFAGAAIARSNPFRTGVNATKLGIAAFLVPYVFVYNPVMLLIGATWLDILHVLITATAGMLGVGAGAVGYLRGPLGWPERVVALVGGVLLVDPGWTTDLVGLLLLGGVCLLQLRRPHCTGSPGKQ